MTLPSNLVNSNTYTITFRSSTITMGKKLKAKNPPSKEKEEEKNPTGQSASPSLSPNLSDASAKLEPQKSSASPSPSIRDPNSPATRSKTNTKTPKLWIASSRGNEHVQNNHRCPRCIGARNGTCRGGPPCQQCKHQRYNAEECQSKKTPSRLKAEKKHLNKKGLSKKDGGGKG